MADFRYYCEEHNLVYSMVRRKDGSSVFGCRKCVEAAERKNQSESPVASKDAPKTEQQNERTNDAEEMS